MADFFGQEEVCERGGQCDFPSARGLPLWRAPLCGPWVTLTADSPSAAFAVALCCLIRPLCVPLSFRADHLVGLGPALLSAGAALRVRSAFAHRLVPASRMDSL